jgi:hypothetical protein
MSFFIPRFPCSLAFNKPRRRSGRQNTQHISAINNVVQGQWHQVLPHKQYQANSLSARMSISHSPFRYVYQFHTTGTLLEHHPASKQLQTEGTPAPKLTITLKMTAFWDVAPCSLVEVDRRFRCTYCLHHRPGAGSSKDL